MGRRRKETWEVEILVTNPTRGARFDKIFAEHAAIKFAGSYPVGNNIVAKFIVQGKDPGKGVEVIKRKAVAAGKRSYIDHNPVSTYGSRRDF